MKLHCFQHAAFEGLGSIEDWVRDKGLGISCTQFFKGDTPPPVDDYDWLIIMGGPMNVYEHEKYPWLIAEKKAIKDAIDNGKKVVGICLGAQLIACVLGAPVVANEHKEIGWFKIWKNPAAKSLPISEFMPDDALVFHWHGDTFQLPDGAVPLAFSDVCANQGFIYKNHVVALQFHLEFTRNSVKKLIDHCGDELVNAPYIQTHEKMLSCEQKFLEINFLMDNLLLNLLNND